MSNYWNFGVINGLTCEFLNCFIAYKNFPQQEWTDNQHVTIAHVHVIETLAVHVFRTTPLFRLYRASVKKHMPTSLSMKRKMMPRR